MGGRSLPPHLVIHNHKIVIGKCRFEINDEHKRLKVFLQGKVIFKGGEFDQGYFNSVQDAYDYVERYKNEFFNCKTIDRLIKIPCK